jgi:proline dehydrogenase
MHLGRSSLLYLSQSRQIRASVENNRFGRRISNRFVAGTLQSEAVEAAIALNRSGMSVTLDRLGEDVLTPEDARISGETYRCLLDDIAAHNLDANVSLKLTQMGMNLPGGIAERIVEGLVDKAATLDSFVRIDMESSEYTEQTIALTERLNAKYPAEGRVGTVIQAYLFRSEDDIDRLLNQKIRIRLCKGAYNEPDSIAFPNKRDVDENYFRLVTKLLQDPGYHGIATHDEGIIRRVLAFVESNKINPCRFEFQMLYGVRRDLQRQLVDRGYRVRVYVPFGAEWFPYFMRRMAERPANLLFVAKNLFRE